MTLNLRAVKGSGSYQIKSGLELSGPKFCITLRAQVSLLLDYHKMADLYIAPLNFDRIFKAQEVIRSGFS